MTATAPVPGAPAAPRLREAVRFWAWLGCVSFGGPAGQIAVMHRELVERRRWISERRFLHALNYCMVLPGPEAQQLATYLGWLLHRTWGGIVAGALFVLPSFALLGALAWLYLVHGHLPWVAGLLYGVKPAIVAIVLHAAWRIGGRTLRHPALWGIAAAAFVAIFAFGVPFPAIVLAAALLGALGGRLLPRAFAPGGGHGRAGSGGPHAAAVVDDDTAPPAHARFRKRRLALVIAAFVAIWALALAVLVGTGGRDGVLPAMAWFFTKAAMLTFGGAYAVLPYVYQGAVEQHGWLTAAQMMDGLALGETTPGPLIMVVAFVGFVGGWTNAAGGAGAVAGWAGAATATLFTFLPSFLFILAGAPLVESTRGSLRYTAPLTGVTAAVVGVIVNLALFFAWHVLWPDPAQAGTLAGLDGIALAIGVAAGFALLRAGTGVIPVIAAAAGAGLVVALLRGSALGGLWPGFAA